MNAKQKSVLLCLFSLLLFFLFIANKKKNPPAPRNERNSEIEVQNLSIREISPQKFTWELNASKTSLLNNCSEMVCKNVQCKISNENGPLIALSAPKTFWDREKSEALLAGTVEGFFQDAKILGENFYYSLKNQILRTSKRLTIVHPNFNVKASRATVDMNDEKVLLEGGVESEFALDMASIR